VFKKIVFSIAGFIAFSPILFGQNELKVGTEAPAILYQKSFLDNYKVPENKAIVLDFWASWCGFCVAGILESNDFISKFSKDIDYIAITDKTSTHIESFIKLKKLKQYFIVDSNAITQSRFGVRAIPYAFLIDKNKIIQWAGHASKLTPEILEAFLKDGFVKPEEQKSTVLENSDLINLPNLQFNLNLTEKKLNNRVENYMNKRFDKDTFQFVSNFNAIEEVIAALYNNQPSRILYQNISPELLNKKISIEYNALNVDIEKSKRFLIDCIENSFLFKVRTEKIDTTLFQISIADSSKLKKHKTIMTNRPGNSWIYNFEGKKNVAGDFTFLNFTMYDLAKIIEREFGVLCAAADSNYDGYDFYKLKGSDFYSFKKELHDNYGLLLSEKKEQVQILIIENK